MQDSINPIILTTESGILSYMLAKHPEYLIDKVETLSGGNTNFCFRIYLSSPATINSTLHETLILKHAKPYVRTADTWELPLDRQVFEAEALKYANGIFSPKDLATGPTLFHHDRQNHVLIMSDAGFGSKTLKELLIKNELPPSLSESLGIALGKFLGILHTDGRTSTSREYFGKHNWAKQISAYYTHGRVGDTLSGSLFNPPLAISDDQVAATKAAAAVMGNEISSSLETIVMGDFWTGNIVVALEPGSSTLEPRLKKVLVVDWELAKLGVAGNDVGQFSAEMLLASNFFPDCFSVVEATMAAFCKEYRMHFEYSRDILPALASMHIGSHLIVITPSVLPWREDEEKTRATAILGTRFLIEGNANNIRWIREQLIGPLYLHD